MEPFSQETLFNIAATHNIQYEPLDAAEGVVSTRISRLFPLPREQLYQRMLDFEGRPRLFSHYGPVRVVNKAGMENVLSENQFLIVAEVKEGGSKLSFSLITADPPKQLVEEIVTSPFTSTRPMHNKEARINYLFEEAGPASCRMTCESRFESPVDASFVARGMIDRIWFDFFENLMIEAGEIRRAQKLAGPDQ